MNLSEQEGPWVLRIQRAPGRPCGRAEPRYHHTKRADARYTLWPVTSDLLGPETFFSP